MEEYIQEFVEIKTESVEEEPSEWRDHAEDSFACSLCGENFDCQNAWILHMNKVHGETKPFFCNNCGKKYASMCGLLEHAKSHAKQQCHLCELPFNGIDELNWHKEEVHKAEKPFECEHCGDKYESKIALSDHCKTCQAETLPTSDLELNKLPHSNGNIFSCKFCEKVFPCQASLNGHEEEHMSEELAYEDIDVNKPPSTDCFNCVNGFEDVASLELHIKTCHSQQFTCAFCNANFSSQKLLVEHMATQCKRIKTTSLEKCFICDKIFSDLQTHMITHSGDKRYSCNECNKTFYFEKHLNIHIRRHNYNKEKRFPCEICGKAYPFMSQLKEHKKIHDEKRDFVCNECGKAFYNISALNGHKITHMVPNCGEKTFVCNICNASFHLEKYLKCHIRRHKYLREKKYACQTCGKSYAFLSYLKEHQRSHHDQRDYLCSECGKGFYTSSILRIHKICHSDEKPYACPICDMKFALKIRQKKHTDIVHNAKSKERFPCDLCSQSFARKSTLLRHKKNHAGIRPHLCPTCGKAFSERNNLKTHLLIHDGVKKFECDLCDKSYTAKQTLNHHMKSAHNK